MNRIIEYFKSLVRKEKQKDEAKKELIDQPIRIPEDWPNGFIKRKAIVNDMALGNGWQFLNYYPNNYKISYRKQINYYSNNSKINHKKRIGHRPVRMDVYLGTMTVGSTIFHVTRGKTVFIKNVSPFKMEKIFRRPTLFVHLEAQQ